jgi:hypothetical protein
MQHAHFDDTQAATMTPGADCNLATVVFHGPLSGADFDVQFYLSELSAITSEFQVFFQNLARNPGAAGRRALELEEQQQAFNRDESLRGIIIRLQCVCSCATTASLVQQAVDLATTGWPADQKNAFLKTMTLRLPTIWPAVLKRK